MQVGKSMIPCVQWIPKGYARQNPITNADLEKQMQEMMTNEDLMKNKAKFDQMMVDEYEGMKEENDGNEVVPVFAKEANLRFQNDEKNLPFGFDASDEEKDDYTIKASDNLILAGKIEDEFSHLEVYVFEESNFNLYVHHDIMLSSFPICMEWLGVDPSTFGNAESDRANLAVLGTFLSDIEIWNLDILDNVEPALLLQGNGAEHMGGGNKDGHEGAIISLSVNQERKNILASGSADSTVKIWDMSKGSSVAMTHKCGGFKPEKVQWHPTESSILFISTDDNHLRAADIRAPKEIGSYKFEASIEDFCFDNANEKEIHISFGNGFVGGLDISKDFKPSYGVQCSKKAITSISMSPTVKGLLTVTSMDSILRVLNTQKRSEDNSPTKIDKLLTRGGNLFNGSFCSDSPYLYCCGSSAGELVLWNLQHSALIKEAFQGASQN